MIDKEKLENAIRVLEGNYKSCVFRHKGELVHVTDIITLLKAQEPIAPHDYDPVIYGHRYTCGNCHHSLWRNDNYCSQCGKAVKWE